MRDFLISCVRNPPTFSGIDKSFYNILEKNHLVMFNIVLYFVIEFMFLAFAAASVDARAASKGKFLKGSLVS